MQLCQINERFLKPHLFAINVPGQLSSLIRNLFIFNNKYIHWITLQSNGH